jgi:hypothetical protein
MGKTGRGGRVGQHHRATPSLRSYDVTPAGTVTITRPDGTIEVQPAAKAKRTPPPQRRRKPRKTTQPEPGRGKRQEEQRPAPAPSAATSAAREKDARELAERGLRAIPAAQALSRAPAKTEPAKPRPRGRGAGTLRGKSPLTVACPACGAAPGVACTIAGGHRARYDEARRPAGQ